MKYINQIDRKELIKWYLEREEKRKDKPIPNQDSLNWNNPNNLDEWLKKYCYKSGVISGFKQWAYVHLSKEDLLDSAIVGSINNFKGKGQLMRNLTQAPEFQNWEPDRDVTWFNDLSKGIFKEEFVIIIRAVCKHEKGQGAKYYIEDRSGRALCYLRHILNSKKESEMYGYIGFNPDPCSNFLQKELGGEFSNNNIDKYKTFEKLQLTINPDE